jgi:hypothetical protein
MIDLPPGVPMFTHDLQQERARLGIRDDDIPRQVLGLHDALADARYNKGLGDSLAEQASLADRPYLDRDGP